MLGLHRIGHGDVLPVHAVSNYSRLPAIPFCSSEGAFRMWEVDQAGLYPQICLIGFFLIKGESGSERIKTVFSGFDPAESRVSTSPQAVGRGRCSRTGPWLAASASSAPWRKRCEATTVCRRQAACPAASTKPRYVSTTLR